MCIKSIKKIVSEDYEFRNIIVLQIQVYLVKLKFYDSLIAFSTQNTDKVICHHTIQTHSRDGSRIFVRGGGERGLPLYGKRGSASLYGGLGAVPPVGFRGKAPNVG